MLQPKCGVNLAKCVLDASEFDESFCFIHPLQFCCAGNFGLQFRFNALRIMTLFVWKAITVDNTPWFALNVRIAVIERGALADTLCVGL